MSIHLVKMNSARNELDAFRRACYSRPYPILDTSDPRELEHAILHGALTWTREHRKRN